MLGLGFGCGLPYPLVGTTFGFWLVNEGVSLSAIGMASWLSLPYALKPFWLPFIEGHPIPFFTARFGWRRDWIVLSQIVLSFFLFMAAWTGGSGQIAMAMVCILVAALSAATQDAFVDGWRIDAAVQGYKDSDLLRLYSFGYRIGLLCSQSFALIVASVAGWEMAYGAMTCLMLLPISSALLLPIISDPDNFGLLPVRRLGVAHFTKTVCTLTTFGTFLAIAMYRLPDLLAEPMRIPLLTYIGLSAYDVGQLQLVVGTPAAFAGILLGGWILGSLPRIGAAWVGAVLQGVNLLAYALLAIGYFHDWGGAIAIMLDGVASGVTGMILVAILSDLTRPGGGSAFEFAVLTSCYALFGKLLRGWSGYAVEAAADSFGLSTGYSAFFILVAVFCFPALWLLRNHRRGIRSAPD